MKRQNTIRAIAAALALTALNLTVLGATDATADINPEDFTVRIDNPFPFATTYLHYNVLGHGVPAGSAAE